MCTPAVILFIALLSHLAVAQCDLVDQHEPSVSASLARFGEPAGEAAPQERKKGSLL